jgi:hypothetical protein
MADDVVLVSDSEDAPLLPTPLLALSLGAMTPATARALRLILCSFRFILEAKVTTSLGTDGRPLFALEELNGESSRGGHGLCNALHAKYRKGRLDRNTHGLGGKEFLKLLLFLNKAGNTGAHLQAFNDMLDRGTLPLLLSNALTALRLLHTEDALCV